jgi:hypothetical protein
VCNELLDAGDIDRDAPSGTAPGPVATVEYVTALLSRRPDLHVTIDDVLAEFERVALRVTRRATAETGAPIVERWSAYRGDELE